MLCNLHLAIATVVTVANNIKLITCFDFTESSECPENCYENSRVLNFLENQKGLLIGECPCVKAPGSNDCLSYDSRIQATSIEEALYEFPDLVNYANNNKPLVERKSALGTGEVVERGRIGVPDESKTGNTNDYTCETVECKSCRALIINGFAQSAGVNISAKNIDVDENYCLRKRHRELNQTKTSRQKFRRFDNAGRTSRAVNRAIVNLTQLTRRKRADLKETNDTQLLGVVTKIGCDYRRGDEISHGWTGLCNLCWQWRKLPQDYYPALLNEVSCDDTDDSCLTGFGHCRPILRSVNVLQNVGQSDNPVWEQRTISMIAACECQVELGTPLHSLVVQ